MRRLHCIVKGRVQSCGFRNYCWKCAKKAGVTGWATNDTACNTRVILEVQGEEPQLDQFFFLLDKGNGYSRIDLIEKADVDADVSEKGFQARYKLR